MKSSFKLALLGTAAAVLSPAAFADVFLPTEQGNGELVLFVKNETTGAVYARGLGVRVNDVLSTATIQGAPAPGTNGVPENFNYSLATFNPDGNLSGFLNGTDSFSWTVMAGDNADALGVGTRRFLTTLQTQYTAVTPETVSNNTLTASWGANLTSMMNTLNAQIPGSTKGDGSSTAANGQWDQTGAAVGSNADIWWSTTDNKNGLGTAANLYVFASSGSDGSLTSRLFQAFDVVLTSTGILQVSGEVVPQVPLPPAVWLLGSALAGWAGIGRRKSLLGAANAA
jgi:hypothetical protein